METPQGKNAVNAVVNQMFKQRGYPLSERLTVCEEHIHVADPDCETCQQEWKEQTGQSL